ncbi:MFS transporter [Sphingomonas sp. A2-49]|uniref:CynX/NimT family MFS transporter n=1 Tax=Sphingomonas sp. A2-49 TaxID=1391375 RepID=UPI0021D14F44|nr:MFS transporter [Sphingomonas sp. A2-49]MCU6453102.1 MFS transporter [Sphingomonas sp. A2-49]
MAPAQVAPRPRALLGSGIVCTAFSLRMIFTSLSVQLPEIVRALALSVGEVALLTTLPVLCLGLCAPLGPAIARRLGTERTLFGAMVLVAAGTALRASGAAWTLFVFSILACGATATANVLLPSLVKRDFANRSSLLTGLYVMAISGGAAFAAAATIPLVHRVGAGWQFGLAVWAVPATLAALLWVPQLVRRGGSTDPVHAVTGLWRDPLAWQVSMFMGLQSALAFSVLSWLAPMLRERGLRPVDAGLVLSILIVVQLATCLTVPAIAMRARNQRALAMILVAGGVCGLLGLVFAPLGGVWIWALVQGLAQGGLFSLALTMVLLRAPNAHVAAHLSSMAQCVGYIPAALAPLLVGLLRAWTGGFAAAGALFALIGLALVWSGLGAGRDALVMARVADPGRSA